jgi:hypothetical protein
MRKIKVFVAWFLLLVFSAHRVFTGLKILGLPDHQLRRDVWKRKNPQPCGPRVGVTGAEGILHSGGHNGLGKLTDEGYFLEQKRSDLRTIGGLIPRLADDVVSSGCRVLPVAEAEIVDVWVIHSEGLTNDGCGVDA